MKLRLGWYVCSACGHCEPAAPPPGEDSPHNADPSAAQQSLDPFANARARLNELIAGAQNRTLAVEKAVYLGFFCALYVGCFLALASDLLTMWPSGIFFSNLVLSAVLITIGMGYVLYYDNDCLRQGCLWLIGLAALGLLAVSISAVSKQQANLALLSIPNLVMAGWLVAILLRDRRSD